MNLSEFRGVFKKLELAFDREVPLGKAEIYFEKLKSWPSYKFEKVVDVAVQDCERFPTLATLFKLGSELQDSAPESKRTPCLLCNEVGSISAVKDGYSTCFRCPKCTNWQGRMSDSIAIWREDYALHGYQLSWHHTDMRLNELKSSDVELVQWLALYMPTLAEKLITKNPSLVSVIRIEKSDPRREAERRRSLQAEELREVR